jgi:tRNA modification GTPase
VYAADTIVAPATASGSGAVAIVRLSGPRAIAILRAIWQPLSRTAPVPRRLALGDVCDPSSGARLDRALAVVMPAPASLTGEDVAEIHCHGGAYLVRRVVALALAQGARLADPGEFSRRAFLNGRLDLTEAEAIADLISARSDAALSHALAQLTGALKERVSRLRSEAISVRAHLEAAIDFADEDIKLPSRDQLSRELLRLRGDVEALHDSFARGRLLREGVRAALVGKPNAGKSSLLNLLLGIDRAIVTPIPGTTRDVLEDSIRLGPHQLVIQDAAGVRDVADEVERIGIDRALRAAADSDIVIAVFDSSRPFEPEDAQVLRICQGRRGIALLNKRDLRQILASTELCQRGLTLPVFEICALRPEDGLALKSRLEAIADGLANDGAGGEVFAISRERHREALAAALGAIDRARESLAAGMPPEIVAVDVTAATDALGAVTGEVAGEDVLDRIFREFCIGK